MNATVIKWLNILGWSSAFIGVLVVLGFTNAKQSKTPITDIKILINRVHNNYFILEDDVLGILNNLGYKADNNRMLESIDIQEIETFLKDNPFVKNADVYTTINGELRVDVQQRKPLIRIFNKKGESFYLDEGGVIMPLSFSYTARVVVANGNIDTDYYSLYRLSKNQKWSIDKFTEGLLNSMNKIENLRSEEIDSIRSFKQYVGLYELAKFIAADKFWNAQISQIYVNNSGDFELIPRVGNHQIILGEVEKLDKKFAKLKLFYKDGLNKTGWNEYSKINLKYKNQVVCIKI